MDNAKFLCSLYNSDYVQYKNAVYEINYNIKNANLNSIIKGSKHYIFEPYIKYKGKKYNTIILYNPLKDLMLEEISMDKKNFYYFCKDGILYQQFVKSKWISLYPPAKKNKCYYAPDDINFCSLRDNVFYKELTYLKHVIYKKHEIIYNNFKFKIKQWKI